MVPFLVQSNVIRFLVQPNVVPLFGSTKCRSFFGSAECGSFFGSAEGGSCFWFNGLHSCSYIGPDKVAPAKRTTMETLGRCPQERKPFRAPGIRRTPRMRLSIGYLRSRVESHTGGL